MKPDRSEKRLKARHFAAERSDWKSGRPRAEAWRDEHPIPTRPPSSRPRRPARKLNYLELERRLEMLALRAKVDDLQAELEQHKRPARSVIAAVESKQIVAIANLTSKLFSAPVNIELPVEPDSQIAFVVQAPSTDDPAALVKRHAQWCEMVIDKFEAIFNSVVLVIKCV